ncbi:cellulose binding domain-containing protein [Solwaraspora sp. WMMD406]|uniref:cellulose binding domain-containing protein n=1 Tax=Solwaraspora sp. WMMD406 TaxID=3016095 RepID=UPI002415B41D|nr:cellulose binding domain-containing protein [Solwaraspora sp. WMMD406]MDG4766473.1 cellulose binding domain-containing protein [Solwaraspora sp. WMMD406]
MRKLLGLLVAVVVGLTVTLMVSTPAQATGVTFTQTSVWSTGYVAEVTVTNNYSIPITGWEVGFTLPAGSTVSSLWNARSAASTPHYIMINPTWSTTLNPGVSTTFGFVVTGTGTPTFLWPL